MQSKVRRSDQIVQALPSETKASLLHCDNIGDRTCTVDFDVVHEAAQIIVTPGSETVAVRNCVYVPHSLIICAI